MEIAHRPLILAADDSRRDRDILAHILEREGYQFLLAAEGTEALALAAQHIPDLILLDVLMPDLNGLEVCQTLKADPTTQNIPVIFLTGQVDSNDILFGFEAGAVDYVTKPFRVAELLARMNVHLELRRVQKEIRTLQGLLPTCASCKKIRDEAGTWHPIESYISQRSEAKFSHGLCPECIPNFFPGYPSASPTGG